MTSRDAGVCAEITAELLSEVTCTVAAGSLAQLQPLSLLVSNCTCNLGGQGCSQKKDHRSKPTALADVDFVDLAFVSCVCLYFDAGVARPLANFARVCRLSDPVSSGSIEVQAFDFMKQFFSFRQGKPFIRH